MKRIVYILQLILSAWCYPFYHPFGDLYPFTYPYDYGYNYAPQVTEYSSHLPTYVNEYIPDYAASGYTGLPQSTLNIMAELPYAVSNRFSVVPMFVVSQNMMNTIDRGEIMAVSKDAPTMTVKGKQNSTIQCTPAVRMTLENPIIVGSLKSNVLFPSEVQIVHGGNKIPIKIGAVIAPVLPEYYVSQQSPVAVRVVYAVPTKPLKITIIIKQEDDTPDEPNSGIKEGTENGLSLSEVSKEHAFTDNVPPAAQSILQNQQTEDKPLNGFGALSNKPDYINNNDAVFVPDGETVVVESEQVLPPKNVTIIEFPDKEAEPQLQVDEEDEELVNRNPPQVLAPAGIVQSTQPQTHVEPFHNDKESTYLETLREDSKKKRI